MSAAGPSTNVSSVRATGTSRGDGTWRKRGIWFGLLCFLILFSGCSRLRLPAIDSTGQRILAPLPTTTSIALPGSQGEGLGCLRCMQDPLNLRPFSMPQPAFQEPAAPPQCLTPAPATAPTAIAGGQRTGPCVPSTPCAGDCKDGPPAVLYGRECLKRQFLRKPQAGERGCILLTPQKIVAPVGGEVILLSGICGTDGLLQMGEPLEWMLTPESVGTFIQVGDDDLGILHRLARIKKSSKKDGSYAVGVTSTKRTLITRGNRSPHDDVQLEKGQTWISVSSPSEGASKVTVLAPESDCWDQRKATATIYWVDARALPPAAQIVPAGQPVELKTRVVRNESGLPARGWKVRYEILQPELATFAGTGGAPFVESEVDEAGNAVATLMPTPGTSGTAAIILKVIRPGGLQDNLPTLELSQHQTYVTWSAPQLAIRAGAPEIASYNVPVRAVANVSNPGNETLRNVRVSVQFPKEINAQSPDQFAQNVPGAVVWDIDEIPAQTQLDLFLDVTTPVSVPLTFEARSESGLFASDTIRIDVFQPSLVMTVRPLQDRYEVGELVEFEIDVKNTGTRVLNNLKVLAQGTPTFIHEGGEQSVLKNRDEGALQPGETWDSAAVAFTATEAGRKCVQFTATADGGQRTTTESCVLIINKPLPTPSMTLSLDASEVVRVGDQPLFRANLANNGQVPLENVKVAMTYDPQLSPLGATDQNLDPPRIGEYVVSWTIPRLEPGNVRVLEAKFEAIGTSPRSQYIVTAQSNSGARANDSFTFTIQPNANLNPNPGAPNPGPVAPELPPATPAPEIPGGAAPTPIPNSDASNPPNPIPSQRQRRGLVLTVSPPPRAVRVGDPIRYRLRVTNDSDTIDGAISLRFNEPAGVSVKRVQHLTTPELSDFKPQSGYILLPDIKSLRPDESTEFFIELTSNQPQTITIQFDGISRQDRDGASARVTTVVDP